MNKICIYGHFGENKNFLNGQTIKTKNIYNTLQKHYNTGEINKVDTYNWKRNPFRFLKTCIKSFKNSENIIILPAQNGVKVFIPLFLFLRKIYKRKVFYIVIGGWLPQILSKKKKLLNKAKKLDKIFVETNNMKEKLYDMGVTNTKVLTNFKNIKPLNENQLKSKYEKTYKLCIFSRILEEKGIEDAIKVVMNLNEKYNECIYELDIYGPIDNNYKEKFEKIIQETPNFINYKGCIDSDKTVQIVKEYFFLLFPTKYRTEGIPGTIIDALCAGVPIIASRWDNVDEIIKDGENRFYL